jgi:hypothetical protein
MKPAGQLNSSYSFSSIYCYIDSLQVQMTFFLQAFFLIILRAEFYFLQINFEFFMTFCGGVIESSLKFYFSLMMNEQFYIIVNVKAILFSSETNFLIIITVAYVFSFFIFSSLTILHSLCGIAFTFKPSFNTFVSRFK